MSAAIKPTTRMCSGCGHTELCNAFGQPWMHCSFCDADTEPLFGNDDLVSAVLAGVALVNGGDVEDQRRHLPTLAQAGRVVARLTGDE